MREVEYLKVLNQQEKADWVYVLWRISRYTILWKNYKTTFHTRYAEITYKQDFYILLDIFKKNICQNN